MMLTMDQLKEKAPAIFAPQPRPDLSPRYQHVSTLAAIEALKEEGWLPVSADQKRSRRSTNVPYAKHIVRFRHESAEGIFKAGAGQAFPEIVLSNAHNGTSSYRLLAGIYVLACSNGLIVAESTIGAIHVRHLNSNKVELLAAARRIAEQTKPVTLRINAMRQRTMTPRERSRFAAAALKLAFPGDNAPFKPKDLLAPRRADDAGEDLWTTLNVVQENLMAGGLSGRLASGRRFTSSPVRDINIKIKRNQALWALTDSYLPPLSLN